MYVETISATVAALTASLLSEGISYLRILAIHDTLENPKYNFVV
jgi:hypothetical protein